MLQLGRTVVVAAMATSPPPATADPPGWTWTAPASCPTGDDVLQRARAFGLADALNPSAEGRVEDLDGRFRLTLTTGEGPARIVESADCTVLADAAALILALSSDPVRVVEAVRAERASPEPAPQPEVPRPEEPLAPAPPAPNAAPEPEPPATQQRTAGAGRADAPRVRYGLRMAGALGAGMLPRLNVGASIALAVFGGTAMPTDRGRWSWRAELGWMHWFPRRQQFEDFDAITGDFRLTGGYLRAGPSYRWRRLGVPLLVGIDLGALTALTRTEGFPDAQGPTRLWSAATVGSGIWWEPSSPLSLWASADMVIPFQSHVFEITGLGVLHEVWPVGLRTLAGLEIRFP